MTARDDILSAVRRHLPQLTPLPELTGPWIEYPDPVAQFASVLETIGGRCLRVAADADVRRELDRLPQFSASTRVVSTVPELAIDGVNLADITDPRALADVEFAILRGEFGVAENAAIWVTDDHLPHRAIYFLCEHLALMIAAREIVHNMHEAYQRLPEPRRGFGTFLAGPSKTADIEQSLVIGAHGPKSLTVFVVG